jgi:hypothetical protein
VSAPKHPAPAPHATRRFADRMLLSGGALVAAAVGVAWVGAVAPAVSMGALGLFFAGNGAHLRRIGEGDRALGAAIGHAVAGRLDAAIEALAPIPDAHPIGWVRRGALYVRSLVALRRGEVEAALAATNAALAIPPRRLLSQEEGQLLELHGVRAYLAAAAGQPDASAASASVVRASPAAPPSALAHAALGEAITLERAGDVAGLRDVLRRERRLLLHHVQPRERAIVRAYQRLVWAKDKPRSPYREGPPREEAREEPPLADWVARVAPGAAPFVRAQSSAVAPPLESPKSADAAAQRQAEARLAPGREATRGRALVPALVVVLAVFFVLWRLDPRSPTAAAGAGGVLVLLVDLVGPVLTLACAAALAAGVGRYVLASGQMRAGAGAVRAATAKAARGDDEGALVDLAALATSKEPSTTAAAALAEAHILSRRGDFAGSIARCDAGLAKLSTPMLRAVHQGVLVPGLAGQRTYALAASGRDAEAAAELAALASACPTYVGLAGLRTLVALLAAARAGDVEGVARASATLGDRPIGPWDELVGDLARAAVRPDEAGAGEIERLADELAHDAEARAWVARMAPAVLAAFEQARATRVAEPDA